MKAKICYITTIALSIEAFFIPQIQYLSENGFEVTVICSNDGKVAELLPANVKYIPIKIPRGISFGGMINAIREMINIFKENKYDLIQYSTPNAAFCASIAGKLAGIKIRNYHLMGYRFLGAKGVGKKVLKLIERIACFLSTDIECVSKSNLELGEMERIFPKGKAVVVWNGSTGGVDLSVFNEGKREDYRKEIRRKYQIDDNEIVFGFVGRITRDKGVNEILEAFKRINNAKLMMVGSLEQENTINKELYDKSLQNTNIIYTGWTQEAEKYYAAIDVLLLPSYREGFGNVVIEAAAMGTPAIISDIPGPKDAVINDVTAKVIPVGKSEELYDAMTWFMGQQISEIGKKASEFVEESFDNVKLNEKILERKKQLLSQMRNKI